MSVLRTAINITDLSKKKKKKKVLNLHPKKDLLKANR